MTSAEAQRRKEVALAKLRELQLASMQSQLLDAAEVEAQCANILADIRTRLLAVRSRMAALVPHFSRSDVALIDAEIRDALK
jgi:hypothetical protein